MVNDEERRDVAARLRKMLVFMRARKDWYCRDADTVECGNAAYRDIAESIEAFGNMISGNYIHIVERLAELIDRPTCRNVADPYDGGRFECSNCGEVWEVTCSNPADNNLNYCPRCGAKVVRDVD